jgi:hypothetical protein
MNEGACTKEGTCTKESDCTKGGTAANRGANDVLASNVQGVQALMPACWNNVRPCTLGNCITRPMGGWSFLW